MRSRATIAALILVGALALFVSPALAKPPPSTVKCGYPLTSSVKLTHDLTNCPGDGLIIGAPGITVDLNGHTIDGNVTQTDCDRPDVFRAGIKNDRGFDGVTIEGGTLRQFDNGIAAGSDTAGMSDSRAHHLTARDNRFGGISLGSGAGAAATANNRIDHNVVSGSGCAAGIDLNTGQANRFADNRVEDNGGTGIAVCCGEATDGNVVEGNSVSGADGAGISVFFSGRIRLEENVLSDIGEDGIAIVGASSNAVVDDNRIERAQGAGIFVGSCCEGDLRVPTDLQITDNTLTKVAEGIILFETDRNAVIRNVVTGAGTFGDPGSLGVGIWLDGASDNLVRRNAIAGGRGPGIQIGAGPDQNPSTQPPERNVVSRNEATSNGADGIRVLDVARETTVRRNTTNRNGDDGIDVLSPDPFTTITRNEAEHNADYGIEAVDGVTDGGGNEAGDNGNPAQCTGVACSD